MARNLATEELKEVMVYIAEWATVIDDDDNPTICILINKEYITNVNNVRTFNGG